MDEEISIYVYYQNVGGLRTKSNLLLEGSKIVNFDIIALTETWLNDKFINSQLFNDEYIVFRCDRQTYITGKERGGGVLLAVKRDKYAIKLEDSRRTKSYESLLLKIDGSTNPLFVSVVYFAPKSKLSEYEDYFISIKNGTDTKNSNYLIMGDFNIPDFYGRDREIAAGSSIAVCLDDFMSSINLISYNNKLNKGLKTLDLVLSSLNVVVQKDLEPIVSEDPHHPAVGFSIGDRTMALQIEEVRRNLKEEILNMWKRVTQLETENREMKEKAERCEIELGKVRDKCDEEIKAMKLQILRSQPKRRTVKQNQEKLNIRSSRQKITKIENLPKNPDANVNSTSTAHLHTFANPSPLINPSGTNTHPFSFDSSVNFKIPSIATSSAKEDSFCFTHISEYKVPASTTTSEGRVPVIDLTPEETTPLSPTPALSTSITPVTSSALTSQSLSQRTPPLQVNYKPGNSTHPNNDSPVKNQSVDINTQLIEAVVQGNAFEVKALISKGANVGFSHRKRQNVLHIAVTLGNEDVVSALLDGGASADCVDADGNMPLHCAARQDKPNIVSLLVRYGCSVNCKNKIKERPLHYAIYHNQVGCVRELMKNGADPFAKDNSDKTPFNIASTEIKELLLDQIQKKH